MRELSTHSKHPRRRQGQHKQTKSERHNPNAIHSFIPHSHLTVEIGRQRHRQTDRTHVQDPQVDEYPPLWDNAHIGNQTDIRNQTGGLEDDSEMREMMDGWMDGNK